MSRLTKIFSAVLGVDEAKIGPELSPENTSSWDSLNAIILVSEVEKAFNIEFNYDEVMSVKNFSDVISLIVSKGGDTNA
ncbi:MAG: acyl carrier protein [Candidatus Portnoybacteria bacterium]|nr:acyl carrier protein [Candidatus Portnoybacteria bacterium]